MPQRSNDFQRLVRSVQKALAPVGARVQESAMVENQRSEREIDVLVESSVGPYKMKIAVEVKDHRRPLGPQQVEEYIGKYRQGDGIPVNHVVIVSSSGFSRGAKDKARAANITLLTIAEAATADWSKFIPPDQQRQQRLRFQIAPHYHRVTFFPPLALPLTRILQEGRIICECCGRDHGLVGDMIKRCVEQHLLRDPLNRCRLKQTMREHNGHALATLNMTFENRLIVVGENAYPFDGVTVEVHSCEAEANMAVKTYEQTDAEGNKLTFQHAKANVAGKTFEMILPDGIKSKRIVLDIRDDSSNSCANGGKRRRSNGRRKAG